MYPRRPLSPRPPMMMMISNAVCLSVRPSVCPSFCLERQRRLALRSWESSESESGEVGGICEGESEEGEREGAKKGHYTATIHPTQLREGDFRFSTKQMSSLIQRRRQQRGTAAVSDTQRRQGQSTLRREESDRL